MAGIPSCRLRSVFASGSDRPHRTHLPYPTQTTTLGNVTTATVSSLVSGTTYYCAVTAYDSAGLDSPVSNEIVYQAP